VWQVKSELEGELAVVEVWVAADDIGVVVGGVDAEMGGIAVVVVGGHEKDQLWWGKSIWAVVMTVAWASGG
jgi:hypothetical protein